MSYTDFPRNTRESVIKLGSQGYSLNDAREDIYADFPELSARRTVLGQRRGW